MPDAALSAALKEAYAAAPVDRIVHHTLELYHPAFSDPVRVVRDWAPLEARLEDGAPRNAGEVVSFAGYAFDLVPPDQTSTSVPQAEITIDNVSAEIIAQIELAVAEPDPITVIFRAFLSDTLDDGPETDPPIVLTVNRITATATQIRATAGFGDLLNRRFPTLDYDLESFPGLAS